MEFICKTCNKSLKFQSWLSRHERTHKQQQQSIECGCGRVFSRRDNLSRHQLKCIELSKSLKSNGSSLCDDDIENSKYASKDEFTQTGNYPSVIPDDTVPLQCSKIHQKLTKSSKDDTSINSLPLVIKRFEAPSEDDEE